MTQLSPGLRRVQEDLVALRADLRGPDDPFDEQWIVGAGTAVTEQPLARGCLDRRGRRLDLLQKRSWQLPEHRVSAKELVRALSDSTGTSLAERHAQGGAGGIDWRAARLSFDR